VDYKPYFTPFDRATIRYILTDQQGQSISVDDLLSICLTGLSVDAVTLALCLLYDIKTKPVSESGSERSIQILECLFFDPQ
jgi:hypothetical protein